MNLEKEDMEAMHPNDIAQRISELSDKEQTLAFLLLSGEEKSAVLPYLDKADRNQILKHLGNKEIADILNDMPPDDRTHLFENFPDELIKKVIQFLPEEERKVALNLLGYPEDSVGRIMTPYYIQAYKHNTVGEILGHIKKFGRKAETLNMIYVIDEHKKLIDDIRIENLLMADNDTTIESLMDWNFVCLKSLMDKEEAIHMFEEYDRTALPVISQSGVLVGIVTSDDIIDVIEKRDTEDIQKFGGLEALDLPYRDTNIFVMIKKRAGWLTILFLGEMFTASAMGFFEVEISKAVVLALFIPLIISSGGNSGSQAATLIIRAMAIKELTLSDWWFVMRKEIFSGLGLGSILGAIGFFRIFTWQMIGLYNYGVYWLAVAFTVALTLIGIVMWGTLAGSMIPFALKKMKLDPATSSAPFVATLVDVTGLIIYFSIAAILLKGKLL
ncbi:MAG: magnesium transporter [Bacteroidia bacterium]